MRVCGIAQLVIESPRPPKCHPEREGGGWGGREGSPHKSWCRSTVLAEILRSPRTQPPLAQDDTNSGLVHRARSFLRSVSATAVKGQDDANFCLGDFFTNSRRRSPQSNQTQTTETLRALRKPVFQKAFFSVLSASLW